MSIYSELLPFDQEPTRLERPGRRSSPKNSPSSRANRPELPIPQESLDALKKEGLFALQLTQNQMTTFGGTAFAGRLPFERYFRDARAGLVMGMANDMAYEGMIPFMFPDS